MKPFLIITFSVLLLSCGNEKSVQLPEVQNAKITKVFDVSPAYIFYDETKPDSVELNRKNLIITTNWLVNIDKRLTLKQALPSIIKLQDKKRNAKMHKNENARNYYTCNDTSIKNLGFIDFTNVVYNINQTLDVDSETEVFRLIFFKSDDIQLITPDNRIIDIKKTAIGDLIKKSISGNSNKKLLFIGFNENLSFQEYITFKSELLELDFKDLTISTDEFIFN